MNLALEARNPPPDGYPRALKTLGDHLRMRRLDLGFLQRDVAQKLGVHEATIYNWENKRQSPQLRFLPSIIEFVGYVPYDTQPQALGKRIARWRRMPGLIQREVAQRLGLDPGTLGCWERD